MQMQWTRFVCALRHQQTTVQTGLLLPPLLVPVLVPVLVQEQEQEQEQQRDHPQTLHHWVLGLWGQVRRQTGHPHLHPQTGHHCPTHPPLSIPPCPIHPACQSHLLQLQLPPPRGPVQMQMDRKCHRWLQPGRARGQL